MMKKRVFSLCAALLLCAALALPALAYPAGIDESLPRVVDEAGLLTQAQTKALEAQAREIIAKYCMDLVILTKRGISGKTPTEYAEGFFDYGGYGYWAEETDDFNAAKGMMLFVEMQERDVLCSSTGEGELVFHDQVQKQLITSIKPQLGNGEYYEAFARFLDGCAGYLEDYANGAGIYTDSSNYSGEGIYDGGYSDSGSSGASLAFNGGVFVFALIIALLVAWIVVGSMKKKHNTIRIAQAAANYQHGFNLTERQDIFLYSNTTRVRIQTESSSGGGGFSGGGSHTSSSGRSHTSVGSKF